MVGALLTVLFLGVLQLGLALHVRNTLTAAAAEGARYAANADRGPGEGVAWTQELVAATVVPGVRAGRGRAASRTSAGPPRSSSRSARACR